MKSLPLSILKDATLGIEVDHFVSKVIGSGHHKRDFLIKAVSAIPFSLENAVDSLVAALKSNGVHAVFVFSGLELASLDKPFTRHEIRNQQRLRAWNLFDRTQGDLSSVVLDESDTSSLKLQQTYFRPLIQLFVNKGIEFMVAPYTSSAQLSYIISEENGYIDAIYGSSNCLLYKNTERLITYIDVRNGNFQCVNKKALLSELGFTHEQFVEAGIAVGGSDVNKVTFPPIEHLFNQPMSPMSPFRAVVDFVQVHSSISNAVVSFPDSHKSPSYADRFVKALACVQFQPVLKDSGKAGPINEEELPNNIHDMVGQRLPDEVLFYLSRGMIGPEMLNVLTSGVYLEDSPFDGGESKEYRDFINKLQPLRSKILSFLNQALHRYYQYKNIKSIFWFDPGKEHFFDKINPPMYVQVGSSWKVSDQVLQKKLNVDEKDISIGSLLQLLDGASNEYIQETVAKRSIPQPVAGGATSFQPALNTDTEVLANVYLRSLHAASYIGSDHKLTDWGKVLAAGIEKSPSQAEQLMVILSLIKEGFLTGKEFDVAYSGGPKNGTVKDREHSLLVSRLAVAIDYRQKEPGYGGPVSRTLLAFQSLVSCQVQTYRWLFESVLVSLLANGDADRVNRKDDEWSSLMKSFPFAKVPSTVTGIATRLYLDEILGGGDSEKGKDVLVSTFKQALDIVGDVSKVFQLWNAVIVALKKAKNLKVISDDAVKIFFETNEWLESKKY